MSTVQGIFGFLLGSTRPSNTDTVISVKHTVLAIAWLAINQTVRLASWTYFGLVLTHRLQLTPEEAAARPRPQRYWAGEDLGKLVVVSRRAEEAMRVGDRVRLKDTTNVPVTRHGRTTEAHGVIEVNTLIVQETQTTIDVLWQDGERETLDARDTVPYLNPDEYDCW